MSAPPQSIPPSHSDPVVIAILAQLREQLTYKDEQLTYKDNQLTYKDEQLTRREQALALAEMKIRVLEERLRQMRIAKYGRRSEKLSDLQLELLDLEPGVSSEEVEAESERAPIAAPVKPPTSETSRRKHPGRNALPAHLERVRQIVACTPEQCICGRCGATTRVIGHEETEVLDVRPAEYFVKVIQREKRACKRCAEQGVWTAAAPERIAAKSVLSDNVIVDLIVSKYADSVPLYRQRAILMRDLGIEVALTTINDAVLRVGELLVPVVDTMKRELLSGSYIQADETHVDVQTPDKRGKNHRAFFWQYSAPAKGVVFEFEMTRGKKVAQEFFKDYGGILHTDGYVAYEKDIGTKDLIHACCWSHARRGFLDALKVQEKARAGGRAPRTRRRAHGRLIRHRPRGARTKPVARRSPCVAPATSARLTRRVTRAANSNESVGHNPAAVGRRAKPSTTR